MTDSPPALTALVVEDEPVLRMEVCELLEGEGYAVLEAKDATKALGCLVAHPEVSLVVTDVDMPGEMDGLALVQRVVADHAGVAVIVVSSHVAPDPGELPEGVPFVARPFLERQLSSALRVATEHVRQAGGR